MPACEPVWRDGIAVVGAHGFGSRFNSTELWVLGTEGDAVASRACLFSANRFINNF